MRATVYGREIAVKNGVICGVNLGYNFYSEHEHGVDSIVYGLNNMSNPEYRANTLKTKLHAQKLARKDIKAMQNFYNTPFKAGLIRPSISYVKRKIIIDNSELKKQGKYSKYLLSDGNYTLYGFYSIPAELARFKEMVGNKRKLSEEDLFYMPDYSAQSMSNNFGFMTNYMSGNINGTIDGDIPIAGKWGSSGLLILLNENNNLSLRVIDTIQDNLESGGMAIIYGPGGIFKDRGLGIVFVKNIAQNIKSIPTF